MVTGKFYRVMACPQLITYKNINSVFLNTLLILT